MTDNVWLVFFIFAACVFVLLLVYAAFRLASAAWHRSKVEVETRFNQGDKNGPTQ